MLRGIRSSVISNKHNLCFRQPAPNALCTWLLPALPLQSQGAWGVLSHCPAGQETRDRLKHTPHVPGLWGGGHCRAGTEQSHKAGLASHSTHSLMMHSQELRKGFFCLKKESQCSQPAALAAGTGIAVCLFNRWPGSHTANQVTHSEGISQMISYHVLNFSPQMVSDF